MLTLFWHNLAEWFWPGAEDKNAKLFEMLFQILAGIAIFFGLHASNKRANAAVNAVEEQSKAIDSQTKSQRDDRFKNAIETF